MKNGKYILVKAPDDFPGKKYRKKYVYEHILVYWQTYGVLPKSNEIIHHKDENTHNNDPSNLELKSRNKHSTEHNLERKKTYVELRCPNCDKIFVREKRNTYLTKGHGVTCCSRKCIGYYTNLPQTVKQQKLKNIFIREFKQ